MKIRFAVAATAALSLAACGAQTKPAADASDASTSSAVSSEAATTAVAAPAEGDKPTRDFLVGKWGTDGDCAMAIDLRADGTSDGPFGNWLYSDGAISFADDPDFKVNVTIIDNETMESTNDSNPGKTSKMTRCP
jgi:hypothetical protein